MKRPKYKELYVGSHRLRQYVGTSTVKVTLSDHRGTFVTCGPLTADNAFDHVTKAWDQYAKQRDAEAADLDATPLALRTCATLAEVNTRRIAL